MICLFLRRALSPVPKPVLKFAVIFTAVLDATYPPKRIERARLEQIVCAICVYVAGQLTVPLAGLC